MRYLSDDQMDTDSARLLEYVKELCRDDQSVRKGAPAILTLVDEIEKIHQRLKNLEMKDL